MDGSAVARISGFRVDGNPRGLVDDGEVVVLVYHGELELEPGVFDVRITRLLPVGCQEHLDANPIAGEQMVAHISAPNARAAAGVRRIVAGVAALIAVANENHSLSARFLSP